MAFLRYNHFQPQGKVIYITGGSTGLGKAVAIEMVKRGASVTIVARGKGALNDVERELKDIAGPAQTISSISADLTDPIASSDAFDQACKTHGRVPDYAMLCAGSSRPKFFIETSTQDLQNGMNMTYWVQAHTAHVACKKMVANRVKGSVVFVSSFLGYASFAGYTTYSPGKYALRGLADTLRSEMLLHNINIHIFMPAGIDSPGYLSEQLDKPNVTKKIEDGDKVISPTDCAGHLIRGLEKGYYQPTSYWITDLVRMQSKGIVPGNNVFLDTIWWFLSGIGISFWRMFADSIVRGFRKEVEKDLQSKGFYVA